MWNSSGHGYHCDGILQGTSKVDVEFFRGMPIIVMEFFSDKGFEILQAKGKVF